MKTEFATTDYEFAHGRSPKGRGSWAFSPVRNPDLASKTEVFWTPGSTTYAEARKLAKAFFPSSPVLYVLS